MPSCFDAFWLSVQNLVCRRRFSGQGLGRRRFRKTVVGVWFYGV